jgi:Xaa-Pro aminopeptidase
LSDLDELMAKKDLQGIVVVGDTTLANPDLTYVVGGNLARGGIFVKRLHHDPILVTSNLDIGTARRLRRVKRTSTFTEWELEAIATKYGRANTHQHLIKSILRSEGINGNVSLYGRNDLAWGVRLADELRKLGVRVVGESSPTTLESARETKSPREIENIRNVGIKTAKIVTSVLKTLHNLKRKRGQLYFSRQRATVGLMKKVISSKLAEENLAAPEGTIFAIGSSGADPHNAGIVSDPIKERKLIVFDIFPQADTGYWFDLTRSFLIGRADAKAKSLFETVHNAQACGLDFLMAGATGEEAMLRACQVIERGGFRTVREVFEGKAKEIRSGFIHSLGHGVGLTIGEGPYLSFLSRDPLKSGQVVTVEPGIYLPRYGGLRIEDTVLVTGRGVDNLTILDKHLEI